MPVAAENLKPGTAASAGDDLVARGYCDEVGWDADAEAADLFTTRLVYADEIVFDVANEDHVVLVDG